MPRAGPVLLVANHPNALVDAMAVATTVHRRVLLTAKATLFEHRALATLLRTVGVVPLRRTQDERSAIRRDVGAVSRNADTFRLVTAALARNGVVLVFPEGISHDAPMLAPLKTGAARMAIDASSAGVRGLRIVPVGLVYEQKERVRSRLLVRIGEPIDIDARSSGVDAFDPSALTAEIDRALRAVTLNFASDVRAARALDLARALAAIAGEVPALSRPRELTVEAVLATRIETASEALSRASEGVVQQADAFIGRVQALETGLGRRGVALTELGISPLARHGVRFLLREGSIVVLAFPVALLGLVAHWMPVRIARAAAMASVAGDPSRDQPAMRTIVLGTGALLLWYAAVGLLLTHWVGGGLALLCLAGMLLAAQVDLVLRDRWRRAWRRARSYLAIRAHPALRDEALAESRVLLDEAVTLERTLLA